MGNKVVRDGGQLYFAPPMALVRCTSLLPATGGKASNETRTDEKNRRVFNTAALSGLSASNWSVSDQIVENVEEFFWLYQSIYQFHLLADPKKTSERSDVFAGAVVFTVQNGWRHP